MAIILNKRSKIFNGTDSIPVQKAIDDLERDMKLSFDQSVECGESVNIHVSFDKMLSMPESYRITTSIDGIYIYGADTLGAIYGVYKLSEVALGVPPLWYWTDYEFVKKDAVIIPESVIESKTAAFKYRGWFINDEDLLTYWKDPSGERRLNYSFYHDIFNFEIAEIIYESCLRSGNNLIIPASFVDILNEPEAELIKRAVSRGLYVSQHHIEPLGVSHYTYDNYWKDRGEEKPFSYVDDAESIHTVWREYAKKWHEIAGENIIWQVGMRGKGDCPVWKADNKIKPIEAGKFISDSLSTQLEIIRAVDKRTAPPVTLTLWQEMSLLMQQSALEIPSGITIIFCDEGSTQTMQNDFFLLERETGRHYGLYYHIAFWSRGPHLIQGVSPQSIMQTLQSVYQKGDQEYIITNTTNIREHAFALSVLAQLTQDAELFAQDKVIPKFVPDDIYGLYEEYFNCLAVIDADVIDANRDVLVQDGLALRLGITVLDIIREGQSRPFRFPVPVHISSTACRNENQAENLQTPVFVFTPVKDTRKLADFFLDKISFIEEYIQRVDNAGVSSRGKYHAFALYTQAQVLRRIYGFAANSLLALDDRVFLRRAAEEVKCLLAERKSAEYGKWRNWYRGEVKADWANVYESIIELLG